MQSFLTALVETLYEIAKAWLDRRKDSQYREKDIALPSELDDWDTEFFQATGKTVWMARCEADPTLRQSAVDLSSAFNNPNPYYGLQNQAQIDAVARQRQLAAQQNIAPGLLGGYPTSALGGALSGILGGLKQ